MSRSHVRRVAGQTALAKEIPLRMDCDDRFLPLRGNNADLDLALKPSAVWACITSQLIGARLREVQFGL